VSLGGLWLCVWQRRWRWFGLVPIAAGYAALLLVRPPDIVVAADASLIAVRGGDGAYLLSSTHGGKINQETWMRRAAAEAGAPWPAAGTSAEGALSCDALGCVYRARGRTVALIRDGAALAEDCRSADLVVSPVPARRFCRGPRVIDRIDLWKNGAYAIWLDAEAIGIESVRDWRGTRPWSGLPERARE
jgi:competence protein ComEC